MYFSAEMILIYTNSYLPIYFSNIIKTDTVQLSFVLFFSCLAFLSRPLISIYFDKKNARRKFLVILSGFAILVSFILLVFSLESIVLFGIYYSLLLAFISISTVGINKIMISHSPDVKTKNKNALLIQFGSIIGSMLPILIFLFTASSTSNWSNFFIIGIFFSTPLMFFIFLLRDNTNKNHKIQENSSKNPINKKHVLLMSLFLFLAFSDRLFSYSIKPWISDQTTTAFFSILWFVLILIYAFGNLIGGLYFKNTDCKMTLLITTTIIGVILFLVPFTNFTHFMFIYGAYFFISGLFLIKLIPFKMELAQNRVLYYQLMTTFSILASIIFTPIGTFLYEYVETEIVIMISGFLIVLSIIPLYFVKGNKKIYSET